MKAILICFTTLLLIGCNDDQNHNIKNLKSKEVLLTKRNTNLERENDTLSEQLQALTKQLNALKSDFKNYKLNAINKDVKQSYLDQKEQIDVLVTEINALNTELGKTTISNEAQYINQLNLSLKTILSNRYSADSILYIKMLENETNKLKEERIQTNIDYNNQVNLKNSAVKTLNKTASLLVTRNQIWKDLFKKVSGGQYQGLDLFQSLFYKITEDINPIGHYNGKLAKHGHYESNNDRLFLNNYILYLWTNLNKSPHFLKQVLTKEDKAFIYGLFKSNTYYESSGLSLLIRGVLQSYKDMDHSDAVMDSLYTIAAQNPEFLSIGGEYISKDFEQIFSNHQEGVGYYTAETWAYSFWVRRHHEGNSEFVYELLKEFHEHVYKGADSYEDECSEC